MSLFINPTYPNGHDRLLNSDNMGGIIVGFIVSGSGKFDYWRIYVDGELKWEHIQLPALEPDNYTQILPDGWISSEESHYWEIGIRDKDTLEWSYSSPAYFTIHPAYPVTRADIPSGYEWYPVNGLAEIELDTILTWTDPDLYIDEWRIELYKEVNGGEWELIIDSNLAKNVFSYDPDLVLNTTYRWKIHGVYTDVCVTNWTETIHYDSVEADTVWYYFSTLALSEEFPEKVINPTPINEYNEMTLDWMDFSWESGSEDPPDEECYDVYFGIQSGDLTKIIEQTSDISFAAFIILSLMGLGNYLTNYYWRVDTIWPESELSTEGDEWSFTTIEFKPPQTTYILISGGNGQGPYDDPPGVQGIDWEWIGENSMMTVRRLVAAAKNTFWYEGI